jgi:hypothetical protein
LNPGGVGGENTSQPSLPSQAEKQPTTDDRTLPALQPTNSPISRSKPALSRAIADSVTIYFKLKIIFKFYFKLATITRALNLKD